MQKLTYPRAMLMSALGLALLAGCTVRPVDSRIPGYLTTPGGALLYNDAGQCWRTAAWRPSLAIPECDPDVVRRQRELAQEEEAPAVEEDAARNSTLVAVAEVEPVAPPAAPAPPATQPFLLSADATFHFGHYRLSYAGEQAVATLADRIRLRGGEDLQVRIIGHTDRIGDAGANQRLSEQRANSVRDKLIELGIPAAAMTAEGRGENQPVTAPQACPDDLVHCEQILCLSPDRRVEVEVSGTQTRVLRPRLMRSR